MNSDRGRRIVAPEGQSIRGGSLRLLQPGDAASLEPFAERYPFKPYHYYDDFDHRRLAEYFHRELCLRLDQGLAHGWVIRNQIKGVLISDYLPWDSHLFGIPMAKVDLYVDGADYREASLIASGLLAGMDEPCVEREIKHLACKVNTQDIPTAHALETRSFRLVDTITVFSLQPKQINAAEARTDLCLREMRDEDLPRLSALSRAVFTNRKDIMTRFNGDPLMADKAGDLYAEWLQNSYLGDQADIVFVAEVDRHPIGFITCKLSAEQADHGLGARIGAIPLNAVDPEYRKLGVYRRLVVKAVDWFRQQGAECVEIKTQIHTLGVHRTWQQLNGRLVNSYHVLHQWRDYQT